ncbi:hypothetical protein ScPMuIL_017798 [Solemya velum]
MLKSIEHYDERRDHIPSAISDLDADVVCLQEVWFEDDVKKIIKETRDSFPSSYSALHDDNGDLDTGNFNKPLCFGFRAYKRILCSLTKCSNTANNAEYIACAAERCGLMKLDQKCISCLILTPASSILQTCITDITQTVNSPGLLLLSKSPLRNPSTTRYIPDTKQVLPRSYLMADVERIGKVVCTHLTSNLGEYYEPLLSFASWEEQQAEEVDHLLTLTAPMTQVVLMGDLNTGPENAENGITGEFEENYNLLTSEGLSSLYNEDPGLCTWCKENPITDQSYNVRLLLDHVMVKGMNAVSAQRLLDDNIEGQSFPLSDHYAVGVTVDV